MQKLEKIRNQSYIYYFILPSILFIIVFWITPNIINFFYSFTDWNTYTTVINFVGIQNFIDLSKDVMFKNILITLKYAFTVTIVENTIALILAFAIERSSNFNSVVRTIFFIPVLIAPIAVGYTFQGILDPNGLLNQILSIISQSNIDIAWLGSVKFTLYIVALVHCWKWFGVPLIVYIAALNTIPNDLVEAAKIEGANFWQIIKNIKIPLIGPAFTFNLALTLIGALYEFDLIFSLTNGGPGGGTEVLSFYVLRQFYNGHFGYGTAIDLILFLVIVILAIPLIIFLRKREIVL